MATKTDSKTASLLATLANRAGTDKDGNSKADAALASHCASLYVALRGEADTDVREARDAVAIGKAKRAARVAAEMRQESAKAKALARVALARAMDNLSGSDKAVLAKGEAKGKGNGKSEAPEAKVIVAEAALQ